MSAHDLSPLPAEAALRLLGLGLSVIPIHSPRMPLPKNKEPESAGKSPLIAWKPYQKRLPTEAEIRAWWAQWPGANVGVITGAISGVIVVDVDGPEGQQTLRQLNPVPVTWRSTTGRGEHVWFKHPGFEVKNFAKKAPGLDFRGDGGYVVAPGSRHSNGGEYRWTIAPEQTELSAPPPWLLNLIGQPASRGDGAGDSAARWWLKKLQGVPKTQRHDTALQIAGHYLGVGWKPEEVEAILLGFAAQCSPPHDAADIRRIVKDLAEADRAGVEARAVPVEKRWPELAPEALYGLAGDFVRLVEPHTEAAPVALLMHFLVMVGNAIGRGAHMVAEATLHHPNLYVCLVGVTAKSRKGSSEAQTRARMRAVDHGWETTRVVSGLSSGEGLIWQVRDPIEKQERSKAKGEVPYETVIVDEGESDKRLTVIEPEFASTLRVMAREGSTLSAIVREAWDRGTLRALTKNSPARATDAHISIIGHVTRDELMRYMDRTEMGNGFANRFLWVCAKRAQELPEGGAIQDVNFGPFTSRLKEAIDFARKVGTGELVRDAQARGRWRSEYGSLSAGRPGLLGAATSRAEAQVLRLSLLYALLDQSREICLPHLEAALAVWRYCDASAHYIFGDALGDPDADEALALLRAHSAGMTRTELYNAFGRNRPAHRIDRALRVLLELALVRVEEQATGGRPAERWVAVK